MTDAVLTLEGLTAGYDEAAVIRDVDLTVRGGEVDVTDHRSLVVARGQGFQRQYGAHEASSTAARPAALPR